jgi:hypothetical protein
LSVDADECLGSSLRDEFLKLKKKQDTAVAYSFPRRAFYLGRWIDHSGWYPDYKTRLYKREMAHWVGEFVHETLVVDGATRRIEADLLHYTCQSVLTYRVWIVIPRWRLKTYARGVRCSLTVAEAYWRILKSYFLNVGFRDGIQGCLIACFAAYYNFLKCAKLWN